MAKSPSGLKICLVGSWSLLVVVLMASLSTSTSAAWNRGEMTWDDWDPDPARTVLDEAERYRNAIRKKAGFGPERITRFPRGRNLVLLVPLTSSSILSPRPRMRTTSETSEVIANDSWDTSESSTIVFPKGSKLGAAGIKGMKPMTPIKGMKPMTPIKGMKPMTPIKMTPISSNFGPMDFNFDSMSQGPDFNINTSWDESESSVTVFPKKTNSKKSSRTVTRPVMVVLSR